MTIQIPAGMAEPSRGSRKKRPFGPVRTCLGCGRKMAKETLVRFVIKNGEVVPDPVKRAPGRGAYCCDNEQCRQQFLRDRRRLARAFRVECGQSSGLRIGSEA